MTFGIVAGGWHNPHVQYAPVGYSLNASDYCLGCITEIALADMNGARPEGCQCAEHVLDMWAKHKGIADRMDESSFDSENFPKSIAYHSACQNTCSDVGCEYGGMHNVDCADDCTDHCAIDCPDDCDHESHCKGEHHDMCAKCSSDICAV